MIFNSLWSYPGLPRSVAALKINSPHSQHWHSRTNLIHKQTEIIIPGSLEDLPAEEACLVSPKCSYLRTFPMSRAKPIRVQAERGVSRCPRSNRQQLESTLPPNHKKKGWAGRCSGEQRPWTAATNSWKSGETWMPSATHMLRTQNSCLIIFPCSSVTVSSHCLLVPVVSDEKSADDDTEDPLYVTSHFSRYFQDSLLVFVFKPVN